MSFSLPSALQIITLHLVAQAEGETLSMGGAAIMAFSIALVLGLNIFCLTRILREPSPGGHHHAPLDIDTQDGD